MDERERLRRAVDWLIFQGVASTESELANRMGYTKSFFSQIMNGRFPLSRKFASRLCALHKDLNIAWLFTGHGTMLFSQNEKGGEATQIPPVQEQITMPREVWQVLQMQAESLAVRDKEIRELVSQMKKIAAQKDTPAASADVA